MESLYSGSLASDATTKCHRCYCGVVILCTLYAILDLKFQVEANRKNILFGLNVYVCVCVCVFVRVCECVCVCHIYDLLKYSHVAVK